MEILIFFRMGSSDMTSELPPLQVTPQAAVIPNIDSLIGDLLDINPSVVQQPSVMVPSGGLGTSSGSGQGTDIMDLLGDGLGSIVRDFYDAFL